MSGSMITVREIEQETTTKDGGFTGKCVPLPGQFTKRAEQRCRAQEWGVKISSCQRAYFVKPKVIGGVPVYEESGWTAYA